LFETIEHVESLLETVVDAGWCDGVCRYGEDEMGRLSSLLVELEVADDASDIKAEIVKLIVARLSHVSSLPLADWKAPR
jgi:hypothetical protein